MNWIIKDFTQCLERVPKQKAILAREYLEEGLCPVVSQESALISGYTNKSELLYKHAKPVVIFGDHTKNVKFIDFDFVVGADGVHILMPKSDILPKFFYYELCSIRLRDLGYARHYKLLKEEQIKYPSLPEQQRIVDFLDAEFEKIDQLKANAEQQLQAAKDLFHAALKEMLTPKDGWKMKTLGELSTDMYRGSGITRDQIREEGVSCVRYGEIYTTYNYWFEDCASHTDSSLIKSPKYFEHGDILFTITGESVEDIAKSVAYLGNEKCLAGGDIVVMKHKQDAKYLSYALSTPDAIKQKGFGKTKLKVVHSNVPSIKSIVVPIPSMEVQKAIAATLDNIQDKITVLQSNYNQTLTLCNDLKQALLKSIFE